MAKKWEWAVERDRAMVYWDMKRCPYCGAQYGDGIRNCRGTWEGNFSGFRFDYASGAVSGFIRVTGVSLESGKQGVEIIVYEH